MAKETYYLKKNWEKVTQEEYCEAERAAGFYPKHGCGPVATASFGNDSIEGEIRYEDE